MKEAKNSFVDSITRKSFISFGKDKVSLVSPQKKTGQPPKTEKPINIVSKKPAFDKSSDGSRETKKSFKFNEFKKKKKFSWHGVSTILLLLPIFLFGLVSYVYGYNNEGKVYSGVRVFGVEAGGKTREELAKTLDNKIDNYKLQIEGENQKSEATYNDLGIVYNKEAVLDEAYSYGRDDSVLTNFINRSKRFLSQYEISLGQKKYSFKKHDVILVYTVNEEKLNKYLADLETKINVNPRDSEITKQGTSMQVVPAVFGKKLKTAELRNEILKASTQFEAAPLKIQTDVANPTISDEKTRVLAEDADKITSKSIVIKYKDKTYTPTKSVLVSWVTFTRENEKAEWKMSIDQTKMRPYFQSLGKGINVYATDKKIRVENGTKEVMTQDGVNGLIIDEATLGSQLVSKLQADTSVAVTMPMKVAPFATKKEFILVANWDKYIDINLSTQTLVAYEKGGAVKGTWRVTTGKSGYATPVGTTLVSGRSSWIRMKGMEGTSEYYNLYPIKWATWFRPGGYALHDAYWRSSFGYPGSHGCINMPDSGASFIYTWADVGTPVIVHY